MRVIRKRCSHCLSPYDYYASGVKNMPYNDHKYCPECKRVIKDALKKIPIRFETFYEETNEIMIDELLKIREENLKKRRVEYPDRLFGEVVVLPMYDMVDPENVNRNYLIKHNNKIYRIETWSKEPEENKIEVKMERELKTGKKTYCKDY